ncbi:lysE type translocator family protein [Asticcacaulis biprosthecium C19]|uniref:LysE type translocator family protein n=1 Tax=Asticcacaulis biprosthecium C19 TaxID=715226 RepID=F4QK23_9CAUL|nr:LysE family translocator [Asticcacaulis biprosthecium]EGF92050.1 lysE type translocator family protein [Asticcacaulis biprosthecium C19]
MSPVDPAKYTAFLAAMALMAISPGPANLFFIRTGLSGKKRNVFAGVLGVNSATLVWFVAAALGLQALMIALPVAFTVMTLVGGLYLVWLGGSTIRHALKLENERIDPQFMAPAAPGTLTRTLREGFMVQMLNPKVLLFFSVVLPPFLDIARPMPAQMSVFAATAIGMDVISMTSYGLLAVTLSHLLQQPRHRRTFDIAAGSVLVLIAVMILWHGLQDLI